MAKILLYTSYKHAAKISQAVVGRVAIFVIHVAMTGIPDRGQVQTFRNLNLRRHISNGVRVKAEEHGKNGVKLLPWILCRANELSEQ
jgi:hypothetical protein